MKRRTVALLAALTLASGVARAANAPSKAPQKEPAHAAPSVDLGVEVLVLHATNREGGIDPRIGHMPELGKPPFSAFKSYTLLERVRLPLALGAPRTFVLPNGRSLRTILIDALPNDTVRFSASIDRPDGKVFLPLLEVKAKVGQSFVVAGQRHDGGTLVLVIRVVS
jgi:hypothetical protein